MILAEIINFFKSFISVSKFSDETKTRIYHTFYTLIIVITAYLFGAYPRQFYILHIIKTMAYLFLRSFSFSKKNYQYYMFDYCYFVNLFSLYVLLINPTNVFLQKILFVSANGPLVLSIIVFKHKFVFHPTNHNIFAFIHLSAILLSYNYRWGKSTKMIQNESWMSFVIGGCMLYIVWLMIYAILMCIMLIKHIISNGYETCGVRDIKLVNLKKISSNEKIQQILYSCVYGLSIIIALLFAPVLWYSQTLHFVYVLFIIASAFWNGSKYYVKKQ
jgi:hypothetical protein